MKAWPIGLLAALGLLAILFVRDRERQAVERAFTKQTTDSLHRANDSLRVVGDSLQSALAAQHDTTVRHEEAARRSERRRGLAMLAADSAQDATDGALEALKDRGADSTARAGLDSLGQALGREREARQTERHASTVTIDSLHTVVADVKGELRTTTSLLTTRTGERDNAKAELRLVQNQQPGFLRRKLSLGVGYGLQLGADGVVRAGPVVAVSFRLW